jgi:hypothetical protein
MPWRISEAKREELMGGWQKMHNEEFHNFTAHKYYQDDQLKEDEMGREWRVHWS